MGFIFRKSIKLGGGLKINLSKSGVGASWGIPGFRVTKKANGGTRTTVSIPGTGISYVKRKARKRNDKKVGKHVQVDIHGYQLFNINSYKIRQD